MEITIEQLKKKFETLPEDLKWAIMGAKIDEKLMQIGENHNLNVRQIGQLSLETHAVMFGFLKPEKFNDSVKTSLELDEQKAKMVIMSVEEKIFKKIKDKLLSLYKKPTKSTESELPDASLEAVKGQKEIIQKKETKQNIPKENLRQKEIKPSLTQGSNEVKKEIPSIMYNKLNTTVLSNIKNVQYLNKEIPKEEENGNTKKMKKIDPYRMPVEE